MLRKHRTTLDMRSDFYQITTTTTKEKTRYSFFGVISLWHSPSQFLCVPLNSYDVFQHTYFFCVCATFLGWVICNFKLRAWADHVTITVIIRFVEVMEREESNKNKKICVYIIISFSYIYYYLQDLRSCFLWQLRIFFSLCFSLTLTV